MKVKEGTIWKDEIGNTYAVVKRLINDKCIVINDRGPGFDLVDYFVLDHEEGIFRVVRLKHYDDLNDALSDNDFTPPNLCIKICLTCSDCGELTDKYVYLTSADTLEQLINDPYLFLNDLECQECKSTRVRAFEVVASDQYTDIHLDDDHFGV